MNQKNENKYLFTKKFDDPEKLCQIIQEKLQKYTIEFEKRYSLIFNNIIEQNNEILKKKNYNEEKFFDLSENFRNKTLNFLKKFKDDPNNDEEFVIFINIEENPKTRKYLPIKNNIVLENRSTLQKLSIQKMIIPNSFSRPFSKEEIKKIYEDFENVLYSEKDQIFGCNLPLVKYLIKNIQNDLGISLMLMNYVAIFLGKTHRLKVLVFF